MPLLALKLFLVVPLGIKRWGVNTKEMCAYTMRCEPLIINVSPGRLEMPRSHNDPIPKCFHFADNFPYARLVRVVFYLNLCTPG